MLSMVIPPGLTVGRPPRSMMCDNSWKVSSLGWDALPKNSTQKAGSKEKDENDVECSIDAPVAELGIANVISGVRSENGKA